MGAETSNSRRTRVPQQEQDRAGEGRRHRRRRPGEQPRPGRRRQGRRPGRRGRRAHRRGRPQLRKKSKAEVKDLRKASKKTPRTATTQYDAARERAHDYADRAHDYADAVAPKVREGRDRAQDAADTAREKAEEAYEALAPRVEHASETFTDDVVPKVMAALTAIAASAAAAKEQAAEAAERAPDAYAVLKGDATAKKSGKGRWVLLLGAVAAGAAVMAYRKSTERPDPWASAGSYTPPKSPRPASTTPSTPRRRRPAR